jgi:hypothetical protein
MRGAISPFSIRLHGVVLSSAQGQALPFTVTMKSDRVPIYGRAAAPFRSEDRSAVDQLTSRASENRSLVFKACIWAAEFSETSLFLAFSSGGNWDMHIEGLIRSLTPRTRWSAPHPTTPPGTFTFFPHGGWMRQLLWGVASLGFQSVTMLSALYTTRGRGKGKVKLSLCLTKYRTVKEWRFNSTH